MLSRELSRLETALAPTPGRLFVAAALHAGSRTLGRLAKRLAGGNRPRGEPVYEFYAEASAPEGALYVDGRLVGHLEGVRRL